MGRNLISIDWDKAASYAQAGCNGVQIAGMLGIHPNTLYEACDRENKLSFSDWIAAKRSKGDAMIIAKQFEAAIKNGDKTMLIWLGKQRLGQRDKSDHDYTSGGEPMPTITLVPYEPSSDADQRQEV
jgi:hypothetical protein